MGLKGCACPLGLVFPRELSAQGTRRAGQNVSLRGTFPRGPEQRCRIQSSWLPRVFLVSLLWSFLKPACGACWLQEAGRLQILPTCPCCCSSPSLPCLARLPSRKGEHAEARASCLPSGGGSGGQLPDSPTVRSSCLLELGPCGVPRSLPFRLAWKNPFCSGQEQCQGQRPQVLLLPWSVMSTGWRGPAPAHRKGLDWGDVG